MSLLYRTQVTYELQYRKPTESAWSSVASLSPTVTVEGLTPDTMYSFRCESSVNLSLCLWGSCDTVEWLGIVVAWLVGPGLSLVINCVMSVSDQCDCWWLLEWVVDEDKG